MYHLFWGTSPCWDLPIPSKESTFPPSPAMQGLGIPLFFWGSLSLVASQTRAQARSGGSLHTPFAFPSPAP